MTSSRDYIEKHVKAIKMAAAHTKPQTVKPVFVTDRRQDITTEATTYSFPARTIEF